MNLAPYLLALTDAERTLWTVLLAVGLVVLVVVVVLLTILLKSVAKVDVGAAGVWAAAKRLAGNTATSWQLGDTANALELVKQEALKHDAMLEERL